MSVLSPVASAASEGYVIQPGETEQCAQTRFYLKKAESSKRSPAALINNLRSNVNELCPVARAGDSGTSAEAQAPAKLSERWRIEQLQEINATRAMNGRAGLRQCASLTVTAQKYASLMAKRGHYSHTGLKGSSPGDRITREGYQPGWWGENIAKSQLTSSNAMAAWILSPDHFTNIVESNFRYVGMGSAKAKNGDAYWVQVFGKNPCPR